MKRHPHQITTVNLRNYKSIEKCVLNLGPLTVLAGRNGAGKSNIIDALAFVSDSLRNTLEYALRRRGGIAQVRRKSGSKPTHPEIGVQMSLPNGGKAEYGFRIAAVKDALFRVSDETCRVFSRNGSVEHKFEVSKDSIEWSLGANAPALSPDRLFLVAASGFSQFRPVYDILTRMVFHNLNPEAMKTPQRPQPGTLLSHDGANFASVIKQLQESDPKKLHRVLDFIRAIGVPISRLEHKQSGTLETIQVLQERGEGRDMNFEAISLSDGTIRALGILVSLVSVGPEGTPGPTLIGIEEPETALHPAAAGALMDALLEGSKHTQLLLTCHSPDLLDHESVTPDMIRPVIFQDGTTKAGTLASQKSDLLRNHLSTAGELLRLDQLEPDPEDLMRQEQAKGTLWHDQA